jgi:hypothetical protein
LGASAAVTAGAVLDRAAQDFPPQRCLFGLWSGSQTGGRAVAIVPLSSLRERGVMASLQDRTETVLRQQILMFRDAGKAVRLNEERERRLLLLSPESWSQWSAFSAAGPVPAEPPAPVMLQRLGRASYRLAALPVRHRSC